MQVIAFCFISARPFAVVYIRWTIRILYRWLITYYYLPCVTYFLKLIKTINVLFTLKIKAIFHSENTSQPIYKINIYLLSE